MGVRWPLLAARLDLVMPFRIQIARVLVVMTVQAQKFPVAAVRWIVVVVVVLMMDREFTKFLTLEFASTFRTDPGKDPECPLPIAPFPLPAVAPGVGNNPV